MSCFLLNWGNLPVCLIGRYSWGDDALDVGDPHGLSSNYYTLNWQSVVTIAEFENVSDRPVVIDRIEPIITRGAGTVVEVRPIERAREENAPLDESQSQYYPPVTRFKGRCVRHDLHPPEGHRLGPEERAMLAIWIRTRGPGRFRIGPQEIFYRVDGPRVPPDHAVLHRRSGAGEL